MKKSDTEKRIAIFPGSFNPFTIGHAAIVERGLKLFDNIIIAIGYNENKPESDTTANARMDAIRNIYINEPRVEVEKYSGLTVNFAQRCKAKFILRGVRNMADFEYERNMADVNSNISDIETVLLFASPETSFISSSIVRELQHNGMDTNRYLPQPARPTTKKQTK